MVEGRAAIAETAGNQSPLERARALFLSMPKPGPDPDQRTDFRTHICADGSRVNAVDYSKLPSEGTSILGYEFVVQSKESPNVRTHIFVGDTTGSLHLPPMNIVLGTQLVAKASPRPSSVNEIGQHTLLDWVESIMQADQYRPLNLTVQEL